jgi:predicted kinase
VTVPVPVNPILENDIATILATLRPSPAPHRVAINPEDSQLLSVDGEGRAAAGQRSSALVLLVGLPGSGKSTFARRLAPLLDAVILESDALRRLLFETPRHGEGESKRLFRAMQAATQRLLHYGRSVIVDATNLRESHRRPFYDIAAKTGARLHVVHLTASEDVILDRLAHRRDILDPTEASTAFEAVFALLQQQEEAPIGPHLRVDTSDPVAIDAALRTLVEERNIVIASSAQAVSR